VFKPPSSLQPSATSDIIQRSNRSKMKVIAAAMFGALIQSTLAFDTTGEVVGARSISCGETVSDTITSSDWNPHYHYYSFFFSYPPAQDVIFDNCHSDFDTVMYLLDSYGWDITNTSKYECDGDDCDIGTYCDNMDVFASGQETFKMEDLPAHRYSIKFGSRWTVTNGSYSISVHCESDADWDSIDAEIDGAVSMSVVVGMAMAVMAMFI